MAHRIAWRGVREVARGQCENAEMQAKGRRGDHGREKAHRKKNRRRSTRWWAPDHHASIFDYRAQDGDSPAAISAQPVEPPGPELGKVRPDLLRPPVRLPLGSAIAQPDAP